MNSLDIKQGSDSWIKIRLGKATASRIADATARTKTGWGASRANYAAELIAERLTGVAAASYTNAAMQWGTEKEPEARKAYAFFCDAEVEEVGFIEHPTIPMSGCSPDGLVGKDGGLEVKCPQTSTHIETLLGTAGVDGKYIKQMMWAMACTGRKWWDFVSYDPRLPEEMRLFTQRFFRDDKLIAELEKDVMEFLAEVDAKTEALRRKFLRREAA